MKAPTSAIRFKNASTLLDFGFNNFQYKKMISKNDIVKSVKVNKGVSSNINAIAEEDVGTLVSKGNNINIEQNIDMPDVINAPLNKGDIIGKITYTLDGETISECNLLADNSISKIGFLSMEQSILIKWFNLLRHY